MSEFELIASHEYGMRDGLLHIMDVCYVCEV